MRTSRLLLITPFRRLWSCLRQTGQFRLFEARCDDGDSIVFRSAQPTGLGFPTVDTWYHLVGVVQPTQRTINLIVNGGEYVSEDVISCVYVTAPDADYDLKLGDGSVLHQGLLDQATIFPVALDVTGAKAWMETTP